MTLSRPEFEQAIQDWALHGSDGINSDYSGLRRVDPSDWTLRHSVSPALLRDFVD